jgi:hypothetical protein
MQQKKEVKVCNAVTKDVAQFVRVIAAQTLEARLSSGSRVRDVSDFRQWLLELADRIEQAENLEQFLSQISGDEGAKRATTANPMAPSAEHE